MILHTFGSKTNFQWSGYPGLDRVLIPKMWISYEVIYYECISGQLNIFSSLFDCFTAKQSKWSGVSSATKNILKLCWICKFLSRYSVQFMQCFGLGFIFFPFFGKVIIWKKVLPSWAERLKRKVTALIGFRSVLMYLVKLAKAQERHFYFRPVSSK